jgi:hypothetical protein
VGRAFIQADVQTPKRARRQRDHCLRELLERRRIRVHLAQGRSKRVSQLVVDDQVVARTGDELGERDLIVVVRIEAQLAPVQTIWKDRLVEIGDGERLGEMLWEPRTYDPHQMAVHPIEVVHARVRGAGGGVRRKTARCGEK